MMTKALRIALIGVLLSTTAMAQTVHRPMPTKDEPGDAPADGMVGPRTIAVNPAGGDLSLKYPVNATLVMPAQTGKPRTPEIVNPTTTAESAPVMEVETAAGTPAQEMSDFDLSRIQTGDNGVRFVSGGVGERDLAHMKAMQKDFRLKLQFSASSGNFLSEVAVSVADKDGKEVLSTTTDGPILLLTLPEGTYTVTATYDNAVQTKKVVAGAKGTKGYSVVFTQPVA